MRWAASRRVSRGGGVSSVSSRRGVGDSAARRGRVGFGESVRDSGRSRRSKQLVGKAASSGSPGFSGFLRRPSVSNYGVPGRIGPFSRDGELSVEGHTHLQAGHLKQKLSRIRARTHCCRGMGAFADWHSPFLLLKVFLF